ncbi:MAG: histidine kinase dimerization/phospho-acceptor domain-containing protein [Kofleriaceae bacterium]|nr:histidine kinase dimerization/phospho-acceptor domain-containing protein [Kofleriaceae bacterium]
MAWAIAAGKRAGRAVRRLARIRYRLLLINLLVVAVPLVGVGFAGMHERQLLAALETDMIHQAELVRATIAVDTRPLEALQPMLVTAARDTRTRIRVLDRDGRVRADSHRGGPPEGPEHAVPYLAGGESPTHVAEVPRSVELTARREIHAALRGRYGSATRLWDNQDRVYLFSALPVFDRLGAVTAVVYVTKSTRAVKLQLFRLRSSLVRVGIATLLATALITLLLSTTIARPLGRLTRRAQRIAIGHPVDARERETRRHDEIGELARAIEAMTDDLERRARDARTLAADISHEFKTPLTGIRGAAELLRDGAADDPEARERFLAMIVEDTARLDRLVSRLLELARVDDDRTAVLPVDLARLARACSNRPWPVPVVVESAPEAIVLGREAALASALENLVANATQFAAAGTSVHVQISRTAGATRVTVANHGPALSPAARAKVWDRFYSTRTASGGAGLGLAIVRSVAHAHGGTVGIACDGGVTSFWFELPEEKSSCGR